MKARRATVVVAALLILVLPALAKENRSGAGFALNRGMVDIDFPGTTDVEFAGYSLFWKYGFTDPWGLLISYRDMDDDEDLFPGEEVDYSQFGVHGVYMWRHGKKVRPHVKFGIANTDLEVIDPGQGAVSEDDMAFSFGGGLEAGSEKVAFYADYDFTRIELSGVDFDVANLALGMIFKY